MYEQVHSAFLNKLSFNLPSNLKIQVNQPSERELLQKGRMLNFSMQGIRAYFTRYSEHSERVLGLFTASKDIYGELLGVDLDDTSVLSVLFRNPLGGNARVAAVEMIGLPKGVVADDNIVDSVELVTALKAMIQQGGIQTLRAAFAMPGSKVVIRQIKLDSPLNDYDAEVRAWQEARKAFPEIIKSIFLDFVQVEEPGVGKIKKYSLILVVARKEDIEPRVEGLQRAGLETKVVDVDYYAYERAYQLITPQLTPDHTEKYVAMVDFNPHRLLFVVMHKKKAIYFGRQTFAGDLLVPLVKKVMGLETIAAPSPTPRSSGLPTLESVQAEQSKQAELTIPEEQKSHAVMTIRRLFQSFYVEHPGRVIEQVVLTGRCALLSEFTQYIEKTLDIPTIIGNPFTALKMTDHAAAENLMKSAPAFMLSCGLAMRGVPLWI